MAVMPEFLEFTNSFTNKTMPPAICVEENERVMSMGRKVSFSMDDNSDHREKRSHDLDAGKVSSNDFGDDDAVSDEEDGDGQDWDRREPKIICKHIDHVNMMGLNKTTLRLQYLINWLVTSLLQLRLPDPEGGNGIPLVHIYGPKIKYERGAAVAFNVKDSGGSLVNPEVVQKLAEKDGFDFSKLFRRTMEWFPGAMLRD